MAYGAPIARQKQMGETFDFRLGFGMSTRHEMKLGAKVVNQELSADGMPRLTGPMPGLPMNSWCF